MTAPETKRTQSLQIAHELLAIEAVKLRWSPPFEWTSGIKSPIYCDNRIIGAKVNSRDKILGIFVDRIREDFSDIDIIAGVATGGIAMGALIADRLKLPFIYVREKAKEHGLMKQIEGDFNVGDRVVLIEDHISTGKSSINAVNALRHAGLEVLCLASIMTYDFPESKFVFKDNDLDNYFSLCDLNAILETAINEGRINETERDVLAKFRENPRSWWQEYGEVLK